MIEGRDEDLYWQFDQVAPDAKVEDTLRERVQRFEQAGGRASLIALTYDLEERFLDELAPKRVFTAWDPDTTLPEKPTGLRFCINGQILPLKKLDYMPPGCMTVYGTKAA